MMRLDKPCLQVVRAWYVSYNDWNVLHVPRPLMIAPGKGLSLIGFCTLLSVYYKIKYNNYEILLPGEAQAV